MDIITAIQNEFKIKRDYVENIIKLIDDGNTIPFIARYRKELTGSCDDQVLRELNDRLNYLRNLEKRKEEVSASIIEQNKMTDKIRELLEKAITLSEVEDIYRPFKLKKKTRASVAKEKGLEPLADLIFIQDGSISSLDEVANEYINEDKGVLTVEDALNGASDIIAEKVSDNTELRRQLKALFKSSALIESTAKTEEDSVYSMYYKYAEPISKIPSHRILALNRGEKEDILNVKITVDETLAVGIIYKMFLKEDSATLDFCRNAIEDSYSRLIFPSIEREIRRDLTDIASEQAIKMFALNLRPLLMQPPIKGKVVLAVDPAYRTGCKIAVIDSRGKVIHTGVVYPTPPQNRIAEAEAVLLGLIDKYKVDCISIGNGTASKESEIFVANMIKKSPRSLSYMVVNEAGASVYSASKLGAAEFPEFDVSLRSAVSIGRRLQDPLAELVKIDPKSIGVGQYQHDMPQNRLSEQLTGVVEDCVNAVGVDLNTASVSLLKYISGISESIAKNIVLYREENGGFKNRTELKKVKKLGPKTFEQCAGFLRIPGGDNTLDNTSVHPEAYDNVKSILSLLGKDISDFKGEALSDIPSIADKYGRSKVAEKCNIGLPTLNDILQELAKPGRDLRDSLPQPLLRSDIMDMSDLKQGDKLRGTVRNVIDFGIFVDIGVHQDGLVHISQICNKYIKHPSEVVKVGDVVDVQVLDVDVKKKRISLTMKIS